MGLFGKNKIEPTVSSDQEQNEEKEQREKYQLLIEKRAREVDEIVGSKGRSDDSPFAQRRDYKFHEDDSHYFFDKIVSSYVFKYGNGTLEDMEQAATEGQLVFEKDQYSCRLVNTEMVHVDVENAVGEFLIEAGDIKVQFINNTTGESFTFGFMNEPANIGALADFFKSLGVRNFYNIVDVPQ